MKKPIIILTGVLFLVFALTIVRVVLSNQLSTTGVDLNKVAREIDEYERNNALLEAKILQASAYLTIAEEAEKRGYTSQSSQIVLSVPLPLAYKQ